jgi:hypothetical protein
VSRRGQPQGSGIAFAFEPPEFQTATTNLCSDMARQMISPFAPIEARPAKDTAATRGRGQVRAKSRQRLSATIGDLTAIVIQDYVPVRSQGVSHFNAKAPRDVVVACSSMPQRLIARGAWLVARRHLDGRDCLHAFEHIRYQRRSNAVVMESSLLSDGDKPRSDQFGKMLARSGARHACEERKLAAS